MLVLADKNEPWNGLLICTDKEKHRALLKKIESLTPHPVLGKWLYLSQNHEYFEDLATLILKLIQAEHTAIGVTPLNR